MHLTAGGTDPDGRTPNAIRDAQIADMVEQLPDLVVGDLNAGPEASPTNYENALVSTPHAHR
jgi:hypothetical protein